MTEADPSIVVSSTDKMGFIGFDEEGETLAYLAQLGIEAPSPVEITEPQRPGYIFTSDEAEADAYFQELGIGLDVTTPTQEIVVAPSQPINEGWENLKRPLVASEIEKVDTGKLIFAFSDLAVLNNVDTANQGAKALSAALDSAEALTDALANLLSNHALYCDGSDGGHPLLAKGEARQAARERAMTNLQNTGLLQKMEAGTLSEEEQQGLNEVIAVSYGIKAEVMRSLPVDLTNTQATISMLPQLAQMAFASTHQHGAGCNHGGEGAVFASGMPSSGSFSLGGGSSLGGDNHKHDHDTPTHKCSGCGKEYHMHGAGGICKRCRGKLNPIKKRRLH